jgi:hypothetical protein
MIIRQGLNFAAHFAAGLAFGALAVAAMAVCRRRNRDDFWDGGDAVRRDATPAVDPEAPIGEAR